MKKKTCFFAHNHRDSADEFKKLLKERIIDLSNGEIKVVFDKVDFGVADDVLDKENLIAKSTTVVLFMSPEYKNKIETKNESSGSYREYKKIIRRLAKNKGFLISVLVSGNIDSAIPEKLRNILDNLFSVIMNFVCMISADGTFVNFPLKFAVNMNSIINFFNVFD